MKSERVSSLSDEYAPILREALEELDYSDYRLAVRSLPAIVAGFLSEERRSWQYEHGDHHELQPSELVEKLSALNPVERIGILDCVVAERYRRSPGKLNSSGEEQPTKAVVDIPENSRGAHADRVRAFVIDNYIEPTRAAGQKELHVRAGDVDKALGFGYRRLPLICAALRAKKFLAAAGVRLRDESGPPSRAGANTTFFYELTSTS